MSQDSDALSDITVAWKLALDARRRGIEWADIETDLLIGFLSFVEMVRYAGAHIQSHGPTLTASMNDAPAAASELAARGFVVWHEDKGPAGVRVHLDPGFRA